MKTCGCKCRTADCGCHNEKQHIHYCPLHRNAERMKELIEKISRLMDNCDCPTQECHCEEGVSEEALALLKEIEK